MADRSQEIANLQIGLELDSQSVSKQLTNISRQTRALGKDFEFASRSINSSENQMESMASAIEKGNRALDSHNQKLQLQEKRYDDLYKRTEKQKQQYDELQQKLKESENALNSIASAEGRSSQSYKQQEQSLKELKKALQDKLDLLQKNSSKLQSYSTDIDRTTSDINKLENTLKGLKSNMDIGTIDGIDEISNAIAEVNENSNGLKGIFDNIDLGNFSNLSGVISQIGGDLGLLEVAGVGAAAGMAGVFASQVISGAIEYDNALTNLQVSFGLSEEKAKSLMNTINQASEGGYNFQSVGEAVSLLQQRFNLTEQDAQSLSQGMSVLNGMDYENSDMVRFMTSAMNDWGMTGQQALDMIMAGQQQGINMNGDFMDTLTEYTPIFSTLGLKGQETFNLISSAMQATGVDSDKAADMIKEFGLTLTDGSKTSSDAFSGLGLNIDDIKGKIDNGSMTMSQALQLVSDKIMGIGDKTERAKALQDIFKGTVEYGSDGIVDAWSKVDLAVDKTSGTMDKAKQAYEGSYQAMQQDLSNEWNELTQSIGAGVVPALTNAMSFANKVVDTFGILPSGFETFTTTLGNGIDNALDGAFGKVLEGIIKIGTSVAEGAKSLGLDSIAKEITDKLKPLDEAHKGVVDRIRKREQESEKATKDQRDKFLNIWNNTKADPKIDTTNAQQQVVELTKSYDALPKEVKTHFNAEDEESKATALAQYNLYEQLPKEVQTLIQADNYQALDGAKSVQDILNKIPVEQRIALLTDIQQKGNMTPEQLKEIIATLPKEERVKIETEIAGNEKVQQTKEDLKNIPKDNKSKVTVDTGNSTQKTQQVKKELDSVNNKNSKSKVTIETAQASKNVTGLKNNLSDYDKKHTNKTKKTTFHAETAQASKNVTGLKTNVSNFVSRFARSFTTTFNVVTKYSSQGSPSAQSKGAKPTTGSGNISKVSTQKSRTLDIPASVQPSPSPMPISTGVSSSSAKSVNPIMAQSSSSPVPMSTGASDTPIDISAGGIAGGLKYDIDILKEVENQLKEVNNQLSILDKLSTNATGKKKEEYLKKQNNLYREQQDILKKKQGYLEKEISYTKSQLSNKGLNFNTGGNFTNYEELLLEKEAEIDKLEKAANKEKASDSDKNKYNNAKSELDDLKKLTEEYNKLQFDELPKTKEEWISLSNTIRQNKIQIEEVKKEFLDFSRSVNEKQSDLNKGLLDNALTEIDVTMSRLDRDIDRKSEINETEDVVALLQEKKKLLKELSNRKHEYLLLLNDEREMLEKEITSKGLTIDDETHEVNYEQKINQLKQSLSNTTNKDDAEKYKKEIEDLLQLVENYQKIIGQEMPKADKEWESVADSIHDVNKEIDSVKKNQVDFANNLAKAVKNATLDIMKVTQELIKTQIEIKNKQIDLLEKESKLASTSGDKVYNNMKSQVNLLNDKLALQKKYNAEVVKEQKYYKNNLLELGIKFNYEGIATNAESILNNIQNKMANAKDSAELSKLQEKFKDITSALGDYNKTLVDVVSNQGELVDIRLEIESVYKSMLDITKKTQDKLTEIYKKQKDDRIKFINEELDQRLKALTKEKDAYNKAREEQNDNDAEKEQLDKIKKLQKEIDTVSRDTSNDGKAKLDDLLNQLAEEKKSLDKLYQDRVDKNVNDMFDTESDRLKEVSDKSIDELEKAFSEKNIANLINKDLITNTFQDIDGNVVSLQDTINDFFNDSSDSFSVLGGLIKNELNSNLEIALDTFKDLKEISKELNIKTNFPNVDYNSRRYAVDNKSKDVVSNNKNVNVSYNPVLNISGNVSKDTIPQLQNLLRESEKRITQNIMKNM